MSRLRSVRYKGFSGNLAFRAPRYTSVLALSTSDDLYASDDFLSDAENDRAFYIAAFWYYVAGGAMSGDVGVYPRTF